MKTIDLKVNNWKKLTKKERKEAAFWLKELAAHLVDIGDSVDDRFTAIYP